MANVVGDVVIRVGADITPLTKEVGRSTSVLRQMEDNARRGGAQIIALETATRRASTAMQEQINHLAGVKDGIDSARASAMAFSGALTAERDRFEALRASMDPLYAASRRYEEVLRETEVAVKLGVATQGEANAVVKAAEIRYLAAGEAQTVAARGASLLGGNSRMLGQQLSQVAQQTAATGNFVQALAIQLPDMALGFGNWAIAAGVVASVAIPALVSAMGSGKDATESFDKALSNAKNSLNELKSAAQVYSSEGIQGLIDKYGELNAEVLLFVERQREASVDKALRDATEAVSALSDEFGLLGHRSDDFSKGAAIAFYAAGKQVGLTTEQVRELAAQFERARTAATFAEKVDALAKIRELIAQSTMKTSEWYDKLLNAEDALRQMNAEGNKAQGWLAAAISGAGKLAGKLWDAAAAAAAAAKDANKEFAAATAPGANLRAGDDERGSQAKGLESLTQLRRSQKLKALGLTETGSPIASKSGGGASGKNVKDDLKALQEQFATEYETVQKQFEEKLAQLEDFRKRKLLTEQQYNELEERVKADHEQKLADMEAAARNAKLSAISGAFGDLAGLMQTGNKKLFAIGQAAAIAQAIVAGYQAAVDAWQKGMKIGGPPLAAAFTAASLAKTGALIAGIKSQSASGGGSAGASGGGVASPAAAPSAPAGAYVNVQLVGGDNYGPTQIRGLVEQINKAIEDGAVLKGIHIR